MTDMGAAEFVHHIRSVQRTSNEGFVIHIVRDDDGTPTSLWGVRHWCGLVDTYTVSGRDDATAARYRAADYERADAVPLWQASGTVLDVLSGVLALPEREPEGTSA